MCNLIGSMRLGRPCAYIRFHCTFYCIVTTLKVQPVGAASQFQDLLTVPVWKHLLERVVFSAPMGGLAGGAMVDGIIFVAKLKRCIYVEEVPEDTLHSIFPGSPRLTWGFYSGGNAPLHDLFTSLRLPEHGALILYAHMLVFEESN
jgi:hypothetical protein